MTLPFPYSARVAAVLLIAAVAGLGASPAPVGVAEGRPIVLLLPGRGYLARDTAELRSEWLDALRLGLERVGAPGLVDTNDFRLVWYADVLDPAAAADCRSQPAGHAGAPASEVASVLAMGISAAALAAEWSGRIDSAPLRALAGDLLYVADGRKRCAAEERLGAALEQAAREGRPIVLLAHSFGSIVAHGQLSTRDAAGAPRIERLVTIGSLVGRPELRRLLFGSGDRVSTPPVGVGSWVNVRDPDDLLAAPLLTSEVDARESAEVADLKTSSRAAGDPHSPHRYLSDPTTARAIVEGWCVKAGAAEPRCRGFEPGYARGW